MYGVIFQDHYAVGVVPDSGSISLNDRLALLSPFDNIQDVRLKVATTLEHCSDVCTGPVEFLVNSSKLLPYVNFLNLLPEGVELSHEAGGHRLAWLVFKGGDFSHKFPVLLLELSTSLLLMLNVVL
jgi:hypothetical protein